VVGYSRAVRAGNLVFVAGTTSVAADGSVLFPGDAAAQTRRCLELIAQALESAGAALADVVRTRIFVTNIADWQAIGRAHGEVFGSIRPASTMVEVKALIDPALVVEIEADAVLTPA
jgi:enamine deaminase RidA (YjgF/YER057c/UK114 family)